MPLPPGPAHILKNLPSLVLPPLSVLAAGKALAYLGFTIPPWRLLLSCFLSLPVAIFLQVQYRELKDNIAAAAHGAVLPPRVYDKWPGGISLLNQMLNNLKDGYPGVSFVNTPVERFGSNCQYIRRYVFRMDEGLRLYLECQDIIRKQGEAKHNLLLILTNYCVHQFFTSEPEYIKAILATMFDSFEKGEKYLATACLFALHILSSGPKFNAQMQTLLGTGVFNSDGKIL